MGCSSLNCCDCMNKALSEWLSFLTLITVPYLINNFPKYGCELPITCHAEAAC
jgi:hypothetical protein